MYQAAVAFATIVTFLLSISPSEFQEGLLILIGSTQTNPDFLLVINTNTVNSVSSPHFWWTVVFDITPYEQTKQKNNTKPWLTEKITMK